MTKQAPGGGHLFVAKFIAQAAGHEHFARWGTEAAFSTASPQRFNLMQDGSQVSSSHVQDPRLGIVHSKYLELLRLSALLLAAARVHHVPFSCSTYYMCTVSQISDAECALDYTGQHSSPGLVQ